jgi:hypothetical protein
VRTELVGLIVPGLIVGVLCAFVLALRVVWSGGLGVGTRFSVNPITFLSALLIVVGSLGAGSALLSRRITKVDALTGMSTRRVS